MQRAKERAEVSVSRLSVSYALPSLFYHAYASSSPPIGMPARHARSTIDDVIQPRVVKKAV